MRFLFTTLQTYESDFYVRVGPELAPRGPEVGNETIRVAAHLIGLARGIPVLFLLYTIFPDPLRISVDTLHAPIVDPAEVRELLAAEVAEVETFRREFIARAEPIREHRRVPIELRRVRLLAGHVH